MIKIKFLSKDYILTCFVSLLFSSINTNNNSIIKKFNNIRKETHNVNYKKICQNIIIKKACGQIANINNLRVNNLLINCIPFNPTSFTGATGPTGNSGVSGTSGNTGLIGDTGATGSTGSDGEIGPQGSIGINGDIGATGISGNGTNYVFTYTTNSLLGNQSITFNNNNDMIINGWNSNNTEFICPKSGIYFISYRISYVTPIQNFDPSFTISTEARLNNITIPGSFSEESWSFDSLSNTAFYRGILCSTFLADINENDSLTIFNINDVIDTASSTSASLNIFPISY